MISFIDKYFNNTGHKNIGFNSPASEEKIIELEVKLGIKLPKDYREFLLFSNGFEGIVNDFVVILDSVENIYESTQMCCSAFFPWAIYIGTNASLEMFVIDRRPIPYQFGLLPFIADDNDFIPLGDTFEKFIERVYNDTAFERRD